MSDQRQGSSDLRCSQCNQTFSSNEELRRHNETQHQQKGQSQGVGRKKSRSGPGKGSGSGAGKELPRRLGQVICKGGLCDDAWPALRVSDTLFMLGG